MSDSGTGRGGTSFRTQAVVDNYRFRPPYPPRLYDLLVQMMPRNGRLLDIGCGPGQIARHLSRYCEHVVAVDPSDAMLDLARSLENGEASNIDWVQARVEDADLGAARFGLVVAANSIHWMDPDLLFAKLRPRVTIDHRFAAVTGDDAHDPPWQADWIGLLKKWIPITTGQAFDVPRKSAEWSAYLEHVDIEISETLLSPPITQSVAEFIACQHSRDAFAPTRLQERTEAFDADLRELLTPHADENDCLTFRTKSHLTAGTIRGT